MAGDRRRAEVMCIVQIQCGAQIALCELASWCIEAQHSRHRQLHARRHLDTAFGNNRLGRRGERRTDAGMPISVGEPADRHLLYRRQGHDAPIVPFEP